MDPDRDEDLAVKKVGEYLTWRRDTNADDLRAKVPSDGPDPSKWPHGDVMYQCLRLIQCSDKYFDREGHAVTVYQAFHWPAPYLRAHLRQFSTAELVAFSQMGAEYNGSQMERISRAREAVILSSVKKKFDELTNPSFQPDRRRLSAVEDFFRYTEEEGAYASFWQP